MYKNGDGVAPDIEKAIGWLGKAAEHGNNDAVQELQTLRDTK